MPISDPELEVLDLDALKVDAYAQRGYDNKWAKELHDNWDDDKVGVFRVSRRTDGGLYLMDGQHRTGALRMFSELTEDERQVLGLVYEGLTIQQEAELYLAFNSKTRKANPVDTFRLERVAEEPEAVNIQLVLDKHGLIVQMGTGAHQVAAVAALRWVYRLGGVDLLDRTFTVIEKSWGVQDRWARDGNILRAIGWVLHKIPYLDQGSLEDKLGKSGRPGQLLGQARTYRMATKRSLWLETAHQVVAIYNHSRRSRSVSL
jgi:hypothetical protein